MRKRSWVDYSPRAKFRHDDHTGELTPAGRKAIIAEHMAWLKAGRPGFEQHDDSRFAIQAFLERTTYHERAVLSHRGLVTERNKFNRQNLKQNQGKKP